MEPLAYGKSNVFWMRELGSDTLTDLDLSYRAQLKNWEFKYLEKMWLPAELPAIITRSQQFRWNKGGAGFVC
jgi:hypothetical protein